MIKCKFLIFGVFFIVSTFSKAQNIHLQLAFSSQDKKMNVSIKSIESMKIGANLEYANERWKEVSRNGLSGNQLYLFVYNNNKLVDNSVAHKSVQPSEPPAYYEKDKKDAEIKQNLKVNLYAKKLKKLQYNILIYPNAESLFNDYSCKIYNCWYEFYTLERGRKYKMQIKLKIKGKIYKSNIVEFVY